MNCEEALKRLKQETCPCTYCPDFDKNECLEVIQKTLEDQRDELIELREERQFYKHNGQERANELRELKEFVKVLCKMKIVDSNPKIYGINENDIALIKKVVEKYGK